MAQQMLKDDCRHPAVDASSSKAMPKLMNVEAWNFEPIAPPVQDLLNSPTAEAPAPRGEKQRRLVIAHPTLGDVSPDGLHGSWANNKAPGLASLAGHLSIPQIAIRAIEEPMTLETNGRLVELAQFIKPETAVDEREQNCLVTVIGDAIDQGRQDVVIDGPWLLVLDFGALHSNHGVLD